MDLNRVEVYICGKKLVIKTKETPEYIKGLARVVDRKFTEAFATDSALNMFDAAILVSMELTDELSISRENLDNIRRQIKEYAEETEKLRAELERCRKQMEDCKDQKENLQCELDMLSLQKKVHMMNDEKKG